LAADSERRNDALRSQVQASIDANRAALDARLDMFGQSQTKAAEGLRFEVGKSVASFGEGLKTDVAGLAKTVDDKIRAFTDLLASRQTAFEKSTHERLSENAESVRRLSQTNADAHVELRKTVEGRLDQLRSNNDAKLEQMRATVDEKLQSTLEKRLGESFKHVSERLEQVHSGLGEMKTLAVGVGDLKKVLTNVKDRGGWAEMQLGALLEHMLARDQFDVNVQIDPKSQESVEFGIKMPGLEDGSSVYLPIDAKFPKEEYERLVAAWDRGDSDDALAASAALERIIEREARKIGEKYIRPPRTTDFAVLYLPTEGLFAEVMRRPGLSASIQAKHRVAIAGPTTLAALLTSLQMGFRTLAIQQKSSEVWGVLGEAKAEFEKYGGVWEKLAKQLDAAQNTVEEAGKRTRAVSRKLKNVQSLQTSPAPDMLEIAGAAAGLDPDEAEL
jgi:DNA recombination protein RmuC